MGEVSKLNQDMIAEIKNVLTVDEKLTVNLHYRRQTPTTVTILAPCTVCRQASNKSICIALHGLEVPFSY